MRAPVIPCQTVGEFVYQYSLQLYRESRGETLSYADVRVRVRRIISTYLIVPDDFSDDAHFVTDLGMG